ncbi:MAG TPA: HAD family hydrolase [Lachnospiraceae bacterium]|nr:HAD family hydrolase [Lachnospiraceae bacterium]
MKCCIFDLDGTLTDTLDSLTYSTNQTLKELGMGSITREQCRMFVGNGARNQISCALRACGDTELVHLEEAMEIYLRIFAEHCTDFVVPYEGIPELLKELKKNGVKLAVHSNKPHQQAVNVVQTIFGEGVFDLVQGQQDPYPRKPDPYMAEQIIKRLGSSEEEATYVGDSEVDIHTGQNAGIQTVGVNWGFRGKELLKEAGAKIMIDRPQELLHYVL